MQNTNAHVASEEREEIPNEGKAAQQLEQFWLVACRLCTEGHTAS